MHRILIQPFTTIWRVWGIIYIILDSSMWWMCLWNWMKPFMYVGVCTWTLDSGMHRLITQPFSDILGSLRYHFNCIGNLPVMSLNVTLQVNESMHACLCACRPGSCVLWRDSGIIGIVIESTSWLIHLLTLLRVWCMMAIDLEISLLSFS